MSVNFGAVGGVTTVFGALAAIAWAFYNTLGRQHSDRFGQVLGALVAVTLAGAAVWVAYAVTSPRNVGSEVDHRQSQKTTAPVTEGADHGTSTSVSPASTAHSVSNTDPVPQVPPPRTSALAASTTSAVVPEAHTDAVERFDCGDVGTFEFDQDAYTVWQPSDRNASVADAVPYATEIVGDNGDSREFQFWIWSQDSLRSYFMRGGIGSPHRGIRVAWDVAMRLNHYEDLVVQVKRQAGPSTGALQNVKAHRQEYGIDYFGVLSRLVEYYVAHTEGVGGKVEVTEPLFHGRSCIQVAVRPAVGH
ncbi:hypothetical protein [Dyella japonica]|uniref:Uncharacterized protein n=1 Tax=Dyella japonica DSM 16301 TaxID=1440762 RepID=A0A0G9H4D3_9GAMM|nr:hypothetical protein [Dyella japonica]KLD64094.1 hypothetical protein Y882_08400 [Dyella japonica DSM 16301]